MEEISHTINNIFSLEKRVREHINTHRYQSELIKDSKTWNQICCCLDTIADTLLSIQSYIESTYPNEVGLKYLYTYGLLQALFIQQDALLNLASAFEVKYSLSPILSEIRLVRNSAIGHPTKQTRGTHNNEPYYNFISRPSLCKDGFSLMRSYGNFANDFIGVNSFEIIHKQLSEIAKGYEQIVHKLVEADKMHLEKYKSKPLKDIFHSALGYAFEKISEGIHSDKSGFGLSMLIMVQETFDEFTVALIERHEMSSEIQFDLNEFQHGLSQLKLYLEGTSLLTKSDARIYYFYCREKTDYFRQIAEEIDEDYNET